VTSRLLDVAARELKKRNQGFYTISSAGHENNAIIGTLLRLDDPCFLHYRSGALMWPVRANCPASTRSSTRCFRSALRPTIRSRKGGTRSGEPRDVGSAADQHHRVASAQGGWAGLRAQNGQADGAGAGFKRRFNRALPLSATLRPIMRRARRLNAARYSVRRGGGAPILFLCEDNGIGISVDTPRNWIHDSFSNQLYLKYFEAAGDIDEIWEVTQEAVNACRRARAPVFLHLHVTRLWGHAGTDVETTYRTFDEITAEEARDPLILNAKRLVETGAASPGDLRAIFNRVQSRIDEIDGRGRAKAETHERRAGRRAARAL